VSTQKGVQRCQARKTGRPGFTAVELVFVMLIAGVLMGLAIPSFREYANRREVMNARQAFMMAAARARASAVERGDVVVLMVRIYRDSVFVLSGDWTDTLEVIDYRTGEIRADILLEDTPAPFRICYTPRGFVHPSCQDGGYLPALIGFRHWNGGDTVWAVINAVGQVEPQ
jgi:prepilin-type N-terminal cleavage/methylation domain-containing protein